MGQRSRAGSPRQARRAVTFAFLLVAALVAGALTAVAAPTDTPATYTLDADFDLGTLVNVNHDTPNNDQLQLDSIATPFNFIWVAASGRGTIIKIDTNTGAILGEYWSAPGSMAKNPSRTTVDNNGNVWAGNRNEASGGKGSVVHIGLAENGQCVDRNGNGVIDTSSGLGDIKTWSNAGSADTNGGVSTAVDECIIHFVRTSGMNVRTLAVDTLNNVWIGGYSNKVHELYDSSGVPIAGTLFNLGCGGYGGLVDGNGVLWSANLTNRLLRYDPGTNTGACLAIPASYSYGLGIDTNGFIWNSTYGSNSIVKIAPAGAPIVGPFPTSGASGDRGVAVTPSDDNVWVANSFGSDVSRLNNTGAVQSVIPVGSMPTGMAVDANGKVWVTNYNSDNVMRIDPATNSVDLTVGLGAGARPYNYSDMTGSTLFAPPDTGTWSVVHDSGIPGAPWSMVSWNAVEPVDSSLVVGVASSTDGVTFSPPEVVTSGTPLASTPAGQYLKVTVTFQRATTGESPVLEDITLVHNQPPVSDPNGPYLFPLEAGPFDGSGSTDPDGDPLTYAWTFGDGNTGTGMEPFNTYVEAGIYDVCLTVYDGLAYSDEVCTTAVIYDPDGGFVTGGGWIDSPSGAYHSADLPFFDGSYYDVVAGSFNWADANAAANASELEGCDSSHLATITSQEEQDAIHEAFGNEIAFAWLGAHLEDVGWQWVTGESWGYTNWQPGEPSGASGENALQIGGGGTSTPEGWIYDGKWNDTFDDWSYPYIVEYEGCGPTGKATFGFVSKYKKGATVPTGSTEFQFHAGDLNFHSTSYDWLVVTGSDFAKFKGEGTINGEGPYKFQIWAADDDPDTFRIKIWYEDGGEVVVYDNGSNQAIGAGSIIIHTSKK